MNLQDNIGPAGRQRSSHLDLAEIPALAQRRFALTLIGLTILITVLSNLQLQIEPGTAQQIAYFTMLLLIAGLLEVRFPYGIGLGLASSVLLAALFTEGTGIATLIAWISALLIMPVRLFSAARLHDRPLVLTQVYEALLSAGAHLPGLALAGLTLTFLGTQIGAGELMSNFWPTLAAMLVFMLTKWLVLARWLQLAEVPVRPYLRQYLVSISLSDYAALVAAPLLAALVLVQVGLSYPTALLLFGIGAAILRYNNRAQLDLTDRITELRALNQMGQALGGSLSVDRVAAAVRAEASRALDTDGLYLAVYNESADTLSFPLNIEAGQEVFLPPRRMENGVTEYILRTRRPLRLSGDLVSRARALGIDPKRSTRPVFEYLGVPLVAGDKVLGVLALRSYSGERSYSESDLRLLQTMASQTAVALQNAQLYEQSRRQASELRVINEVAGLLNRTLSLDDLIRRVCQEVIALTGTDKAAVFLVTDDGEKARLAGNVGLSPSFTQMAQEMRIADSPRLAAIRSGEVLAWENIQSDAADLDNTDFARSENIAAVIDIPLRSGDRVIGSLSTYFSEPRRFEPRLVELLDTLGAQVGIAVQNARLFEAMAARTRQLEALYDSSTAINASLSTTNVLRAVSFSLLSALEMERCSAWVLDDERNELQLMLRVSRRNRVNLEEPARPEALDLIGQPALHEAIRRQATTVIGSHDSDLQAPFADLIQRSGIESGLLLPIVMHGAALGLIVAGWPSPDQNVKADRILTAEALANQAAVAIENARLFERTDVALNRRLEQLAALEALSQRMSRRLDLGSVIEQVTEAAQKATGADLAELALYDADRDSLRVVSRLEDGQWRDEPAIWPASAGVTGRALRTGEPLLVQDVTKDRDFLGTAGPSRSELAVPILLDQTRLGVINLESARVSAFSREHVRFVANLAKQAAIAIENARLFEAVNRRADEFRSLRSIAIDLLSTLNLRDVLHVIARAGLNTTRAFSITIYLYDQASDRLDFGANLLRDGRRDIEVDVPRPNGLTATVARTGERLVVKDLRSHPVYSDELSRPGWETVESLISIPLRQGARVIGVFDLALDQGIQASDEMLRFLELLASQAAVAITGARYADEINQARNRMQALLDSIHDGIVMLDYEGRLVLANPRAEYLLNFNFRGLRGHLWTDVLAQINKVYGDGSVFGPVQAAPVLEEIRRNPFASTRRSYTLDKPALRAIEETSIAVSNPDDALVGRLFIMRDVTQEFELEQLRQDMSQMIVHDLRSPLGGVITALQLAIDELANPPDKIDLDLMQSTLSVAQRSAASLLNLVETMLDVNKLESGEMPLRLESIALSQLLDELHSRYAPVAAEASISLKMVLPPELPAIVADREKLDRVLNNLIDNALRYTPRDGLVQVQVSPGQGVYQFTISDSGAGVPLEMRERIFERFVQLNTSRRQRGPKGSGLGLTFCKLAVEAHGGRIWVTDGSEGGSAFQFTLPTGLEPRTSSFL